MCSWSDTRCGIFGPWLLRTRITSAPRGSTNPNEVLIRKAYDAFGSGDLDTIGKLFADDIAFHVPGKSPLSGDHVGRDQVFEVFSLLAQITGNTFRTDVYDILASDQHAAALQRWTAKREGKAPLDIRHVTVFHIQTGKVTEIWHFASDLYAHDEFFS